MNFFAVAIYARRSGLNFQGLRRCEILLIHHKKLDLWLPVGGRIEPGETPLQAAQRELEEETGFAAKWFPKTQLHAPDGYLSYDEHPAGPDRTDMCFNFVADVSGKNPRPCDEWSSYLWSEQIPKGCPPNVIRAFALAQNALHVRPCPDCRAMPGKPHESGCDIEICSACHQQRITCRCSSHDKILASWTGHSPGTLECIERGWYCTNSLHGPSVPCDKDAPGAQPDLNRWRLSTLM